MGEGIEEDTQENAQTDTDEEQEKQILEVYFSYGDDMTRLEGDPRYSNDVNLHIETQGYEDGEKLDITLEFQQKTFQTYVTLHNNQATIMNVFKT